MERHRLFGEVLQRCGVKSSSKPSSFTFDVPMACACVLILDQQSGFAQSDLVPLQHFFVIAPLSRYNLTNTLVLVSTHFWKRVNWAWQVGAHVSVRKDLFDPIKQSSLAVNSRDTKHWVLFPVGLAFCGFQNWKFQNGTCLLFTSRIFDIPSPLLEF